MRAVPFLARAAIALGAYASTASGCTEVNCVDSFRWSADLPDGLSWATVSALVVHACRNGACIDGGFAGRVEPPLGAGYSDDHTAPVVTGLADEVRIALAHPTSSAYAIEVDWNLHQSASDVDRFLVEIRDSSERPILGLADQPSGYGTERPNGALAPGPTCHVGSASGSTLDAGGDAP